MMMQELPENLAGDLALSIWSPASLAKKSLDRDVSSEESPPGGASLDIELIFLPQSTIGLGKRFLGDLCDDLWECILDFVYHFSDLEYALSRLIQTSFLVLHGCTKSCSCQNAFTSLCYQDYTIASASTLTSHGRDF